MNPMLTALIVILFAVILMFGVASLKVASDADDASETVPSVSDLVSEDVVLIAKMMQSESTPDWPDWAVELIGEALLNRVGSWRFPDTVHDVVYADNPVQFPYVFTQEWQDMEPEQKYVDLAESLVNGARALDDQDMVFFGPEPEGTKTLVTYLDRNTGTRTYFCAG